MRTYTREIQAIIDNVEKVIVGKEDVITQSLAALLAGGHVLLEDVPGVGKTMLVRAFSRSIGLTFKRVQFTPDLLPSDLTGVSMYNQKTSQFEYRPGPLMGNIVLADEINRTSPKTQSALLEGMAEANVTVDGEIHTLPNPFFVMATQNPIEHEGTYPLPEAQLDRFLVKVKMGYPDFQQEMKLLNRFERDEPIDTLESVIGRDELLRMKEEVKEVHVSQPVKKYIVQLVQATREHASLYLGASPRSSIALMKVAQAWAYMEGRKFVLPDDVKHLLTPVLSHRLILTADARYHGQSAERVLEQVKKGVAVPIQHDVESL